MFVFLCQSPNKPTVPQDRIRPLSTLDHTQSPFYDPLGGAMPSLARVVVERIARKVHATVCACVCVCVPCVMHVPVNNVDDLLL